MMKDLPPVFPEKCYGYVQEIAVTADRRGEGVAHRLYAWAEAWLAGRGAETMTKKVAAVE